MAGWSTEDVGATESPSNDPKVDEAMEVAAQMVSIVSPLLVHSVPLMAQLTKFVLDFQQEVHERAYDIGYSEGQENYECDEDHGSYDSGYDSGRESRDGEVTSLEEEVEELREKIKELEDQ